MTYGAAVAYLAAYSFFESPSLYGMLKSSRTLRAQGREPGTQGSEMHGTDFHSGEIAMFSLTAAKTRLASTWIDDFYKFDSPPPKHKRASDAVGSSLDRIRPELIIQYGCAVRRYIVKQEYSPLADDDNQIPLVDVAAGMAISPTTLWRGIHDGDSTLDNLINLELSQGDGEYVVPIQPIRRSLCRTVGCARLVVWLSWAIPGIAKVVPCNYDAGASLPLFHAALLRALINTPELLTIWIRELSAAISHPVSMELDAPFCEFLTDCLNRAKYFVRDDAAASRELNRFGVCEEDYLALCILLVDLWDRFQMAWAVAHEAIPELLDHPLT